MIHQGTIVSTGSFVEFRIRTGAQTLAGLIMLEFHPLPSPPNAILGVQTFELPVIALILSFVNGNFLLTGQGRLDSVGM